MKRKICIIAVLVFLLAIFYGCAAKATDSSGGDYYVPSEDGAGVEQGKGEVGEEPAPSESTGGGTTTDIVVPGVDTDRKLVYTVDLYIETYAFSADYKTLMQQVKAAGGYVSRENTYGTEPIQYGDAGRVSVLSIRVPVEQLEAFLAQVESANDIVKKNMNVADNTDSFYDLESRIELLEVQYDKLAAYLESATIMEDVITLESRMSEILYELDSLKGTLRGLQDDIDYSTVNVTMEELVKAGSVAVTKESLGDRIKEGFDSSLKAIGLFFEDAIVFLVAAAPVLIMLAAIAVAVIVIIKLSQRSRKKRLQKNGAPGNNQ